MINDRFKSNGSVFSKVIEMSGYGGMSRLEKLALSLPHISKDCKLDKQTIEFKTFDDKLVSFKLNGSDIDFVFIDGEKKMVRNDFIDVLFYDYLLNKEGHSVDVVSEYDDFNKSNLISSVIID